LGTSASHHRGVQVAAMKAADLALVEYGERSDDSSNDESGEAPRTMRRVAMAAISVSVGMAVLALAGVAFHKSDVSSSVGTGQESRLWSMQPSDDDTGREFMDSVAGLPGIPYSSEQLQSLRHPPKASSLQQNGSATTPPPVPTIPERATVNSNDCFKGEEYFAGACYKNCSALTAGQYPIRSAPNTCCSAEPCIFPSHLSFQGMFVCMGYAVDNKGGCPRKPGHCNSDEEIFEGMCYSPCASLTENSHPFRAGPSTCCKYEPPCFNFANLKSEGIGECSGYNIGGSGHDCAHEPGV